MHILPKFSSSIFRDSRLHSFDFMPLSNKFNIYNSFFFNYEFLEDSVFSIKRIITTQYYIDSNILLQSRNHLYSYTPTDEATASFIQKFKDITIERKKDSSHRHKCHTCMQTKNTKKH